MRPHESAVPCYPIQNALTAPLRQEAARQGRPEFMSMWAGQGAGMSRILGAAELVETFAGELGAAVSSLAAR